MSRKILENINLDKLDSLKSYKEKNEILKNLIYLN